MKKENNTDMTGTTAFKHLGSTVRKSRKMQRRSVRI